MSVITAKEAAEYISPVFEGKWGAFLFRLAENLTGIDLINGTHERIEQAGIAPGPDFAKAIFDDIEIDFRIGNAGLLDHLPDGPFITISNHIYGHLDGICLVDLIGHVRPKMKVMVNELLLWIKGLAPNFIAVTPKTDISSGLSATSISGVKNALLQIRSGEPLALFPSGAVADPKPKEHWALRERDWQDAAVRLIQKARVPVVPIRFFDRNSWFYYGLQLIDYRIRFLRLFHEMYNKRGTHPRVGLGPIISVEEQERYKDLSDYKAFIRSKVDEMPQPESYTKRSELWK